MKHIADIKHIARALCIIAVAGVPLLLIGENPENLTDSMAKLRQKEEKESEYMQLVERADEAAGKGKWEDAVACLQAAMRSEPSNAQNIMLLSNVGMMQFYMGEDSLALRTLSEARAMAPASVVILSNRAKVLTHLDRLDDALSDYNLVVSMDSTYAPAYLERGTIQLRRGRTDLAEADIAKYRAMKPADAQGKLLQAVIFASTGRPADAIPLYTELIEAKKESVYYSARAMCYLETGELPEAADDIASGLEIDPRDPELYFCRARLNLLRYRPDDARVDARRAVEFGLNPLRAKALFGDR